MPTATASASPSSDTPPRVVLDSNVWIDILVFDDPFSRPIRAALESGALLALIDARCLAELTRVLDYAQFRRFELDQPALLRSVAQLTTHLATTIPGDARPLPQCSDRDDQKFLELAHAAGAGWLVTKDRALLKLARRVARDFAFRIEPPAEFVAACGLSPAAPAA